MAARKKNPVNPARKSNDFLTGLGVEIPDLDDFEGKDDSDDEGLESELQALLSGKSVTKATRPKQNKNVADLDKMVADCMRNPSIDDDDGDISGDEDLLNELHCLTGEGSPQKIIDKNEFEVPKDESSVLNLLNDRLELYKQAEAASKRIGDNSKTRRYGRAIKVLKDLIGSAKAGIAVSESDIPPVVQIPQPKASVPENKQEIQSSAISPPPVPSRPAPRIPQKHFDNSKSEDLCVIDPLSKNSIPSSQTLVQSNQMTEDSETSKVLLTSSSSQLVSRRNQYKVAALNAKKSGDTETALKYVKIAKKFDLVIEALENGQSVDLSDMPPSPPSYLVNKSIHPGTSVISQPAKPKTEVEVTDVEAAAMAAANEPTDTNLFNAPDPPATILEALEQRLQKYCSTRDAAKNEGNNSKARRLQRIVQQYEQAIKNYKAGKPVAFEELATPPGFAPIPFENQSSHSVPSKVPDNSKSSDEQPPQHPMHPPQPLPQQPKGTKFNTSGPNVSDQFPKGKHPKIQRAGTLTILDKQLSFLLERQKLFRQAALESKKNGDIQQAKHYLSMSKGFDSMIEATKCGLPIDATTIPTPPQLESDFVIINESDCNEGIDVAEGVDVFSKLVEDLQQQVEMCTRNKEHFMRLGDVSSASKFEKLCLDTKKDLVFVQHAWRDGEPVPRFHYETRLFSSVQCNTDLADDEIEISVERGINLPGKPNDLDAYIKIEFPIPQESPQRAKSHTIKDTNNPEYHETFKFTINRKSRSQLRQFKRQSVKFEVWSKGSCLCCSGFFRSDFIIGTVMVKLVDLETKCSIHNSFDLLEGRKQCGGKLEVKIKVRDPLLSKQIEEVKEKWLIIGC